MTFRIPSFREITKHEWLTDNADWFGETIPDFRKVLTQTAALPVLYGFTKYGSVGTVFVTETDMKTPKSYIGKETQWFVVPIIRLIEVGALPPDFIVPEIDDRRRAPPAALPYRGPML